MKPPYNTKNLFHNLLFAITLLAVILSTTHCGTYAIPKAFRVGSPNPLDEPGHTEPTQDELHVGNIQEITGNYSYHH